MTIIEIITEIEKLVEETNMTFEEVLEWISRSQRDENILPWEE